MTLPRVLLVEDDASLRRFVQMALEELPLALEVCENVSSALATLALAPVMLLITDLMMPGESGLDLLRRLQAQPALRGQAKVVVLSAGIDAEVRHQLEACDVWQMLEKPVSLATLLECVHNALEGTPAQVAPLPGPPPPHDDAQTALDLYFGGDATLFGAYRDACRRQFPADVDQGDSACRLRDLPRLMQSGHSLKTVLKTLGLPALAEQARWLEQSSRDGEMEQSLLNWRTLRAGLLQLATGPEGRSTARPG